MKKSLSLFIILIVLNITVLPQKLERRLDRLTKKYPLSYEMVKVDSFFTEKYILYIDQPVDYDKPDGERFKQRVFLSHLDYGAPVVFITEGYNAKYAENPKYVNELSPILNANQICVEHRYFGKSVPDSLIWDELTVENAARDHHRVVEILRNLYDGKWISTGISKGGQTTIFFRYFYPDDVDFSVPYVAPLNFSIEDERVYRFLDQVGTDECRQRILDFQIEMMKNKKKYFDDFKALAEEKKLTYKVGYDKAYDLIVFEYSFAFWQWGRFGCDDIPDNFTNPELIVDHLDKVAGIDWISIKGIAPTISSFYQFMAELGFYGYDIEPFAAWTSYTENPNFEFTLPEGVSVKFDPELMQQVDYFVRHEADNMLFIYGENDPWSATSVDLTYQTNSIKIVKPGGNHRTRINNLPEDQKKIVLETLNQWLND